MRFQRAKKSGDMLAVAVLVIFGLVLVSAVNILPLRETDSTGALVRNGSVVIVPSICLASSRGKADSIG
jgi:hypothetical protein